MTFYYAESTEKPAEFEKNGGVYYIRKDIVLNEATEERPAIYTYQEAKGSADDVITYQQGLIETIQADQELQNEVLDTLLMA